MVLLGALMANGSEVVRIKAAPSNDIFPSLFLAIQHSSKFGSVTTSHSLVAERSPYSLHSLLSAPTPPEFNSDEQIPKY